MLNGGTTAEIEGYAGINRTYNSWSYYSKYQGPDDSKPSERSISCCVVPRSMKLSIVE